MGKTLNLELLLQICMVTVTTLGTLLMGIGERDAALPAVAILIAMVSVYVTDYRKLFRLNATVANIAGMSAVLYSLTEFSGFYATDIWLMAVAHLLTYLQFVLLFQEKNERGYWLLLSLSLLQVAVAAALSLDFWFGLLLVVYLFLSLVTLSLFFLHREQLRFESVAQTPPGRMPRASWVRRRWPLAGKASQLRTTVQFDPVYGALTWNFLRRIGTMVGATLALTVCLFFLVPRVGEGTTTAWDKPGGSPVRTTGFAEDVEINDLGEMLENPEKVMQVRFEDALTGEAIQIANEPLFRGTILSDYRNGRWARKNIVPTTPRPLRHEPPPGASTVRQIIDLEPLNSSILFGVYPWAAVKERDDVIVMASNMTIERPEILKARKFRYELYTWGLSSGIPANSYPHYEIYRNPLTRQRELMPARLHTNFWIQWVQPFADEQPPLTQLKALADRLAPGPAYTQEEYHGLDPAAVRARAQALEHHLRDSGEYHYSLKARRHDPQLDPVEDFLINRKEGHCEYYASALTLMLRAKGIPARMVSGFKGGEWNTIGEFYQLRQFDAHTWVEAYMPGDSQTAGGNWLVMDPTPSGERANAVKQQYSSSLIGLRSLADYLQFIWSGYVLGMDPERQQQAVYEPLLQAFRDLRDWLFDRQAWSQMFHEFWSNLTHMDWSYFRGQWFSWRGFMVSAVFCLTAAGLWRLSHFLLARYLGSKTQAEPEAANDESQVEFYRRLESLLARHRLVRGVSQTPREFAIEVGGWLADQPERQSLSALPRRVADVFYRIRFGGAVLDKPEAEAVEQALEELESRLSPQNEPELAP